MPQMAPMNWTLMFMIFVLLYLVTMIMVYFQTVSSNSSSFSGGDSSMPSMPWKW